MIRHTFQNSFVGKAILVAGWLVFCLAACKPPNPLGEVGPGSFGALYAATKGTFQNGYFVFNMPAGRDYVAISADFHAVDNILIGMDLSEFMQAGFNPQLLKKGDFGANYFVYDLPTSSMVLSCHIDAPNFHPLVEPTISQLYAEMLRSKPGMINFQPASKSFTIDFGNGSGLVWPEFPVGSTESVSLVIDAAPFLNAGLKGERLQKWKLENSALTAADGKTTTSFRLRLAFRLP